MAPEAIALLAVACFLAGMHAAVLLLQGKIKL